MARPKKVQAPKSEMKIQEINLEQGVHEVLEEISGVKDLMLLGHAYDQESAKGNRPHVLAALEAQRNASMSHGDGAEDATGMEEAFKPYNAGKPKLVVDHAFGDGAYAKQNLTHEQRLTMTLKSEDLARRVSNVEELFRPLTEKNGNYTFTWGSITAPQKEILPDKDLKTSHVPYRASKLFLKFCPRCGKRNQHEYAADGVCFNAACSLDMTRVALDYMAKHPGKLKGVEFERPDPDAA